MNKRAFSLRRRLLIILFPMLALGFLALALSLYDTRDELRRISLSLQAEEIAHDFQTHDFLDKLPRYYADGEMSYSLYNAQGGLLQISDNLDSPRRLRPSRPEDELALFKLPQRSGNIVSVSVTLSNGDILMVAKRDERERELIGALLQARMWRSLMLWLPFCALGLLLITWLVHWTLRPVRQAAQDAPRREARRARSAAHGPHRRDLALVSRRRGAGGVLSRAAPELLRGPRRRALVDSVDRPRDGITVSWRSRPCFLRLWAWWPSCSSTAKRGLSRGRCRPAANSTVSRWRGSTGTTQP